MFLQKCEVSINYIGDEKTELRLTVIGDSAAVALIRHKLDHAVYEMQDGIDQHRYFARLKNENDDALRQTIDQQVDDLDENEEIYRFIDGDVNTDTEWFEESIGRSVSVTKKDGDYWAGYFVDDGLPFVDVHKKRLEKCDDGQG